MAARWRHRLRVALGLSIALAGGSERPPPRERLLALVRGAPGITVGEVRDQLGIGWGTLYHHLHVLERERQVEALAVGRRSLLYPAGHDKTQASRHALLRGATVRVVASAIRDRPACSVRDIIRATRLSPRVVYHHVRRLAEAELVTSRSRTHHHEIVATDLLVELLAMPLAERTL